MANVEFYSATMGAGKTIEACKIAFNWEENGLTPLCLMPEVDSRAGEFRGQGEFKVGKWESRMPGVSRQAFVIPKGVSIISFIQDLSVMCKVGADIILIDEVQFLDKDQVEELFKIAKQFNTPVKVFGLLTNFQTELFEGSKRLIELGAKMHFMSGVYNDGLETVINGRFNSDGTLAVDGQEVIVGGNEMYKPISLEEYWRLKK